MNLETKITIYKFTPQVFTLTPIDPSLLRKANEHRNSKKSFTFVTWLPIR